jgi:hypothetical protein
MLPLHTLTSNERCSLDETKNQIKNLKQKTMKTQKQYAVLHISKGQGGDSGMSAHIERTITPGNVDPERTRLNRQLIGYPDGVENRTQAIQHRIENAGIKRKISKNQVRVLRVMLTGTHEQMKELENIGQLDEWVDENLRWLKDTFGEQNIVSAHLHLDEKTPHIHASVVPIVSGATRKAHKNKKQKVNNNIRLSADDIMTRTNLKKLQDVYAEAMNPFGLERGIDGSKAKHITTAQHYRELYLEIENLRNEKLISKQEHDEILQQIAKAKSSRNYEELKTSLSTLSTNVSERLGSFFDSSGRKQRDEKIAELENQLAEKKKNHAGLQIQHNNEIAEIQAEQAKILKAHNDWRKLVEDTIPLLWERLRIAEILRKVFRMTKKTFAEALEFKLVRLRPKNGDTFNVTNPDSKQSYKMTALDVQIVRTIENPEKLELRLDDVEHTEWFKRKADEQKPIVSQQQTQQQTPKIRIR